MRKEKLLYNGYRVALDFGWFLLAVSQHITAYLSFYMPTCCICNVATLWITYEIKQAPLSAAVPINYELIPNIELN